MQNATAQKSTTLPLAPTEKKLCSAACNRCCGAIAETSTSNRTTAPCRGSCKIKMNPSAQSLSVK
jgi:hypothetical protein